MRIQDWINERRADALVNSADDDDTEAQVTADLVTQAANPDNNDALTALHMPPLQGGDPTTNPNE